MHELGLLTSVVSAVEDAAAKAGAKSVEAVGVKVGGLSGVVPEALQDAWPIACYGTIAEGSRLDIEYLPAAVACPGCDSLQEVDEFYALTCPACGTPTANLVQGREFNVAYADFNS